MFLWWEKPFQPDLIPVTRQNVTIFSKLSPRPLQLYVKHRRKKNIRFRNIISDRFRAYVTTFDWLKLVHNNTLNNGSEPHASVSGQLLPVCRVNLMSLQCGLTAQSPGPWAEVSREDVSVTSQETNLRYHRVREY